MNNVELKEILRSFGWMDDSYGHMKKSGNVKIKDGTVESREYRIKFQKISVRVEVRCKVDATQYSPSSYFWAKICGDYMKNIKLMEDGRLKIGTRLLKGK